VVDEENELAADDETEDPEDVLQTVRRELVRLTAWRTSAPWSSTDEARYQSLCDSELKLLERVNGVRRLGS
jgi:hypothetical protein